MGDLELHVERGLLGWSFGRGSAFVGEVSTPSGERSCPCRFDAEDGPGSHRFALTEVGRHEAILFVADPMLSW